MKLVKEYINEKFSEESDPIKDLGIGIYSKHNFEITQEALDYMWEILPYLCGGKIPEDIIINPGIGFYNKNYGNIISDYYAKYLFIDGKNVFNRRDAGMGMWHFNNAIHNALIRAGYPLSQKAIEEKRYDTSEYSDKPELRIKNKQKNI